MIGHGVATSATVPAYRELATELRTRILGGALQVGQRLPSETELAGSFGVSRALSDPQTAARGLVVETDHPRFGTVRQVASPVRVGLPGDVEYVRAPRRNEHADEILEGLLGYDHATRSRLEPKAPCSSA